MKISNSEERLHILDSYSNVWSVIKEIADSGTQEDAFYVCDVGNIFRKHKMWKTLLPRVQPYYAVKCNDTITVLEMLASLGVNFNCASKSEINTILNLDVNPERIIYTSPMKPSSQIRHANTSGVAKITFDNESELEKIKTFHPDAKLLIKIQSDFDGDLGMKFGSIADVPNLLQRARELDLNVIGVSFHHGSNFCDVSMHEKVIEIAKDIFDIAAGFGFDLELLDIGGGFYGEHGTLIDEMAEVINSALDLYFPDNSIRVIAEPSSYYVSSAFTLACNIHSIRDVINEEEKTHHKMYYINDGVYGSFSSILYDYKTVLPQPLHEISGRKFYSSSVWGPTCDSLDRVVEEILLPEMQIGDWLVFENMGAYTLPVSCKMNGFPSAKIHIVVDRIVWNLMKDVLTLTDDELVMNRTRAGLKNKFDVTDNFILNTFPIKINGPNTEHVLDFVGYIQE